MPQRHLDASLRYVVRAVKGTGLAAGANLGGFVVEHLIGTGGMAMVYRANQSGVNRPVALKVLDPSYSADSAFVVRFQREASVMRDLEHPAVLPVYAAGEDRHQLYFAMRLVTGLSLAQHMAEARISRPRALSILRAVAGALDHAHSRGVIHRDVKPSNVLIDEDGRPFLSDFGIARKVGAAATSTGYLGTPLYMAPEQASRGGAVGHRADLYSLACIAFEMLTGSLPYGETDTVPLLVAHATRPVQRPSAFDPTLPRSLDSVLMRGMSKQPAERYPSAHAFVSELEQAMSAVKVRRRPWHASRRRSTLVAVTAAAVVVLGAGVLVGSPSGDGAGAALPAQTSFRAAPAAYDALTHGPLIYEAPMNGTSAGFVVSPATEAPTARESIRYVPGALELELYRPGGETYSELDIARGLKTFAGEMDVAARPGSDVDLCWSLRWGVPNQLANFMCLDTAAATVTLMVFRRGQGMQPIGRPVDVPKIRSGATVRLATLVRERQLSLYVDGALVSDVANNQVPAAETLPGIELESGTGVGAVRIEGLRLYALGAAA